MLYANLFVGPFLQDVDLSSFNLSSLSLTRDSDEVWEASATLSSLIHSSPAIENLKFNDDIVKRTSHPLATLHPASWSKLKVLDLEVDTSPEFVPVLGRLPALKALTINFGSSDNRPSYEISPSGPLFPRLTLLRALGSELKSILIQLLLSPENAPRLTDLTLIAEDYEPTARFLQDWFTVFLANRTALTDITVFVPATWLGRELQATLGTIEPLFALTNLVNLNVAFPFALADAALLTIARTWPSLHTPYLGGKNQPHHPTDATLGGLVRLVANIPRLRNLTLDFDASDVAAAWKARREIKGACSRLRELCVGASRILDAPAVAKFLRGVFPTVRVIEDDPGPRGISLQGGVAPLL